MLLIILSFIALSSAQCTLSSVTQAAFCANVGGISLCSFSTLGALLNTLNCQAGESLVVSAGTTLSFSATSVGTIPYALDLRAANAKLQLVANAVATCPGLILSSAADLDLAAGAQLTVTGALELASTNALALNVAGKLSLAATAVVKCASGTANCHWTPNENVEWSEGCTIGSLNTPCVVTLPAACGTCNIKKPLIIAGSVLEVDAAAGAIIEGSTGEGTIRLTGSALARLGASVDAQVAAFANVDVKGNACTIASTAVQNGSCLIKKLHLEGEATASAVISKVTCGEASRPLVATFERCEAVGTATLLAAANTQLTIPALHLAAGAKLMLESSASTGSCSITDITADAGATATVEVIATQPITCTNQINDVNLHVASAAQLTVGSASAQVAALVNVADIRLSINALPYNKAPIRLNGPCPNWAGVTLTVEIASQSQLDLILNGNLKLPLISHSCTTTARPNVVLVGTAGFVVPSDVIARPVSSCGCPEDDGTHVEVARSGTATSAAVSGKQMASAALFAAMILAIIAF